MPVRNLVNVVVTGGATIGLLSTLAIGPAATGAPDSADGSTRSEREIAAAVEVRDYLRAQERPAEPGPSATQEAPDSFGDAEADFLRGFPIEAGIAQWGCTPLGAGTSQVPQGVSGASGSSIGWYKLNCGDADVPTLSQITNVRPGLLPATDAATAQPGVAHVDETCEAQRGGEHCFAFQPGFVVARYRWLDRSQSLFGVFRVAKIHSFPVECHPGTPLYTSPIENFNLNDTFVLYYRDSAEEQRWSNVLDEFDSLGRNRGTRSLACQVATT